MSTSRTTMVNEGRHSVPYLPFFVGFSLGMIVALALVPRTVIKA